MTAVRGPTGVAAWRHEIPTHLDVEDQLLFGLPARRALALLCGLALAYTLWHQWPGLPEVLRACLSGACVLASLGVVYIRPGGRGLETWALLLLRHVARRRSSVWRPLGPPATTSVDQPGHRMEPGWQELAPQLDWEHEAGAGAHPHVPLPADVNRGVLP